MKLVNFCFSFKNHIGTQAITLITVVLTSIYLIYFRLSHVPIFSSGAWDIPILIDGTDRLVRGYRPHVDYISPLGIGTFLIPALGVWIENRSIHGMLIGTSVFAVIVFSLTWYFARRSSLRPLASVIAFAAFSMSWTPRMFNFSAEFLGFTGIYNLWCAALLIPVFISTICRDSSKSTFIEGIVVGLCTAFLLAIKISFAAAAIGLAIIGLVSRKNGEKWAVGAIAGASIGFVIHLASIGFHLGALLRDWAVPILSKPEFSNQPIEHFIEYFGDVGRNRFQLCCYLAAWSLGIWNCRRQKLQSLFKLSGLVAGVLLVELLIVFSITQAPELFLGAPLFAAILLQSEYLQSQWSGAIAAFIVFFAISENVRAFITLERLKDDQGLTAPHEAYYSDFKVIGQFHDMYEQGPHPDLTKGQKVLVVGWPNYISAARGEPPARNAPLWIHKGVTFSSRIVKQFDAYSGDKIFSDIDMILIPQSDWHRNSRDAFIALYEIYLKKTFKPLNPIQGVGPWKILIRKQIKLN